MVKITVIVPVHNVELYLSRCLDSILEQTYRNYDVILIDDGSLDKSGEICDIYEKKHAHFHVIHQKYRGVSEARNAGLKWCRKNSSSSHITFVDSDDWIHPKYLETLISATKSVQAEVSVVGFERTTGVAPVVDLSKLQAESMSPSEFFCKDYTHLTTVWGKLYPKSAFHHISFPKGKIHEDEYVTWKILFSYSKIAIVQQPLYAYFRNPVGIMGSSWSLKRLDMLNALEERLIFFQKNHHSEAFEIEKNHYLWHIMDSLKHLCGKTYAERRAKYRVLLRFRRLLKICNLPILEHEGLYELAYPKTFRLRWAIATRIQKSKGV